MSYDENSYLDTIEKVSKTDINISAITLVPDIFYQAVPARGTGSSTIIDDDLILTNNHMVDGAEKIDVTLWNNHVLEVTIVGSSAIHDIAVVKVARKYLQSAQLGDSDNLRVGQRVLSIGSPFSLAIGPSVTSAVVIVVNRTIELEHGPIENHIQTDASINPRNSGCLLIDLTGKVVAIQTVIISYAQGIGFAILINSAKNCTDDILTHGTTKKAWPGIVGLSITLHITSGVLLTKVDKGIPAEAADMEDSNIILQIETVELLRIEDSIVQGHKRKLESG